MPANELPKRFVTLDVYKSVAMTVVLCLSALEHIRACRGMDCNWTQPTFYFEYMSGLFFVLQGIGNARSIVRQHNAGATWWRVMRVQLLRGESRVTVASWEPRILIIDDFLASGQTLMALSRMVNDAKATLVGVGVVVEKIFEDGREAMINAGFDVPIYALASIVSMDEETITLG